MVGRMRMTRSYGYRTGRMRKMGTDGCRSAARNMVGRMSKTESYGLHLMSERKYVGWISALNSKSMEERNWSSAGILKHTSHTAEN